VAKLHMFGNSLSLGSPPVLPLADGNLIQPMVVLGLCIVAGIGTVMLLPARQDSSVRKLGGTLLTLAGLLFVVVILQVTGGPPQAGVGWEFWIFSGIAIVGAIRVVTHPRPVYSALYFILTVFATAGLFILMYAEFMAAALVLIYAGAILVTYVFVIMLAASAQGDGKRPLMGLAEYDAVSREPFFASCIGFILMGVLLFLIFDRASGIVQPASDAAQSGTGAAVHGSTQALGEYLFENQIVNLELAGLILTVAMVGAIVIARRRVATADVDDAFEPSIETINATMTPLSDDPRSIPVYGTTNPRQKAFPQN